MMNNTFYLFYKCLIAWWNQSRIKVWIGNYEHTSGVIKFLQGIPSESEIIPIKCHSVNINEIVLMWPQFFQFVNVFLEILDFCSFRPSVGKYISSLVSDSLISDGSFVFWDWLIESENSLWPELTSEGYSVNILRS